MHDSWAGPALTELSDLAGVRRVGMALVEGGGRRLLFTASDRVDGTDLGWCHIDAYDDVPLNDAIRTALPVIGGLEDLDPRYAPFVEAQRAAGYEALAAVPLVLDERVLGAVVVFYDQAQEFGVQQRTELHDLVGRLALGLQQVQQPIAPPVVPDPEPGSLVAGQDFPFGPVAVSEARRFLRRTLAGWSVEEDTAEDAVLCLSELVTNALVHTHGGCHVQVELRDHVLTTRVHDTGAAANVVLTPPAAAPQVHGRGLQVVDALASSWGQTADPPPASVWFTLELR